MKLLLVLFLSLGTLFSISWTTKTPMPQALAGSGCAVINDTVYVIGGRDSDGNRYTTNYIYIPSNDSWSSRSNMTTARAHLGCAYVNGKIYAIGGWAGSTATGACEEYDPVSDSWQTKAALPTPRYTLAIATVAGKIYVFGGMNMSGQVFNTVEEYDPVNNIWAAKANMPTARFGPACAVVRDTIYVYGGSAYVGGGLTTVNEYYVPANNTWGTKTNMPSARYCHAGFCYSDQVYALGGYDYYNYLALCQVFNPISNSWATDTPMQYSRQSLPVAVVGSCVYAIAGWNNGSVNYTEEGLIQTGVEEHADMNAGQVTVKAWPNPFSSKLTIHYTLSTKHPNAALRIFDSAGRLVKSFSLSSAYSIVPSVVTWSGDDEAGNKLPSGTYFVELSDKYDKVTKKVMLLR
ncbi:MAG TPA: kelch repeat-containing protein [bacterium]|jgi:N-acetylneuraminic acid mutarotase